MVFADARLEDADQVFESDAVFRDGGFDFLQRGKRDGEGGGCGARCRGCAEGSAVSRGTGVGFEAKGLFLVFGARGVGFAAVGYRGIGE
jgi:hypothetical protein